MVTIISRSAWGARSPRARATTSWDARTGVTVHYSFGSPTQTPRQIQDFHMDSNGWSDIGYNFLVDTLGNAYEGRGWLVIGAHAAPYNTSHIGVCFIGSDGDATPAAKRAIRAICDEADRRAGRALPRSGHRDLNSTSCPGDDLYQWVRDGMPTDGTTAAGGDDVIGLKKGDTGEHVLALQALILYAGGALPQYGADGDYGDETASALLAVRRSVGSEAKDGWGDTVTGWAYAQLMAAVARRQG
ncbi:MarR family transcriptional regulator [Nocardiopsis gilva YIM 90087]|uniref:MarR family transcriptional regulator n=1 Tax=Nocardiopsis gilva YIM 90087 TaxID=1235441 RepID=A0A223S657_9ACTN|nr:N-acetylmuramoyl-L-alanine amidase [Nocardiopsis gilva]ASU83591.1 MarR family transcriptional regulator [Nocardiopsis gilva YIM 90087]